MDEQIKKTIDAGKIQIVVTAKKRGGVYVAINEGGPDLADRSYTGLMTGNRIGRYTLSEDRIAEINSVITQIYAMPEYTQTVSATLAADAAEVAQYRADEALENKNGYCARCGGYCYGDCTSHR